MNRKGKIRTE